VTAAEKPYSPISDSEINPHIAAVVLNFFDGDGYAGSTGEKMLIRAAVSIDPYLQRVLSGEEPGGFAGLVAAVRLGQNDVDSLRQIIKDARAAS
jgi:hypothetical protein